MANNPNDTDPMPAPKKKADKASKPELKLPPEDAELPATEPMTGPPQAVPPLPEGDAFDSLVPLADPASGIQSGTRLPVGISREDPEAAVGNLEPVAPVAPASGWLDSDVPLPSVGPASQFPEGDLEVTPKVESSDIFSTGAVPPAPAIGGSDVIMATAFGPIPVVPEEPTRPSDVAISFDQPPGGSTIKSASGSGELPVADEAFEGPDPMFDSSRLGAVQPPSADAPDYGSTPDKTEDTSSILADLSDPGEINIDDSFGHSAGGSGHPTDAIEPAFQWYRVRLDRGRGRYSAGTGRRRGRSRRVRSSVCLGEEAVAGLYAGRNRHGRGAGEPDRYAAAAQRPFEHFRQHQRPGCVPEAG